ncbi:type IV secretory system conjugative DNA transfer family protein [Sphingobacterium shayense]|uniref:type IV secretory system conjugative DNA transfer family protein n=1 Tax=Sphingobacterium shayense TaxID=626343 RepID=UPI0015532BDA|nr:type IV secretory system conjugative DNA transfer family protein [Sphingobacterium shayense]NQD72330.1 type IV secretory system conjugative DNA transfer family protein [Sphingobacterium shayense]
MEETKEQQRLHALLQLAIYFSVFIELYIFILTPFYPASGVFAGPLRVIYGSLARLPIYADLLYSKLFTLVLILLTSVGTRSRKSTELNPKMQILLPLAFGLASMLAGLPLQQQLMHAADGIALHGLYAFSAIAGALLCHIAMDNVSKLISSRFGKDKWNVEGESFMQQTKLVQTEQSVNIPMQFYFKGKVLDGWINIVNIFRAVITIGVPGSGKTFGIINPAIRQLIAKEFSACIYDYKHPDLGKLAYYHYTLARNRGKCKAHAFHVINLTDPTCSRRINPWRADYIRTLAEASESAEALVEALKKGDKSGGADQFFTQSAINFLAACIYFFAQHNGGKYSSLPHVLSFLNGSYQEIFDTLFSMPELHALLSPFQSAFAAKAFNQLEGQIGTLKIFLSRLATKETFWVFSGDDFDLKISAVDNPSILVIANDPGTQSVNSACYSVVINRITKLLNSKGNLPSALIIDEVPTLYIHKIENLIAVARSNKVAVILGLQELPQFRQQYGKDTAATITSVVGNVLAGSVRSKDTLEWLERLLGKVKQRSESLSIDRNKTSLSISEKLEPLVPAGKIASLKTGEIIGILAGEPSAKYDGKFETSAVNCKVNLDQSEIDKEEQLYRALPQYYDFKGQMNTVLLANYNRITTEVQAVIASIPGSTGSHAPQHTPIRGR